MTSASEYFKSIGPHITVCLIIAFTMLSIDTSLRIIVMATSNPSAAPPYSKIADEQNPEEYIADEYLPSEALTRKALYVRKPRSMTTKVVYTLLSFFMSRQKRYLAGDNILPFRWKAVKSTSAVNQGSALLKPDYNQEWMTTYAANHGTIDEAATTVTPAAGPSGEAADVSIPRGQTRTPLGEGNVQEDNVIERLDSERRSQDDEEDFTSRLDAVTSDKDDDDDDDEEAEVLTLRQVTRERTQSSRVSNSRVTSPPLSSSSSSSAILIDAEDVAASEDSSDDLDDVMGELEHAGELEKSPLPVGFIPPSWSRNILSRKIMFLRAVCTNAHFLRIVDWFETQVVSKHHRHYFSISQSLQHDVSPVPSPFPWARWDSDAPHLPEDVLCNAANFATVLQVLRNWKQIPNTIFSNVSSVEIHLLIIGMLFRDMDLCLFSHDVDSADTDRPLYFSHSVVTLRQFNAVTVAIGKIANCIPVHDVTPAPSPSPTPTHSSTLSMSVSPQPTPPRPRPQPRKKKPTKTPQTAASSSAEPSSVPHSPSQSPAPSPSGNPKEKSTKAKGKGSTSNTEDIEGIRRGSRDRHLPKRFEDSAEPLINLKGKGRGAVGPKPKK